MAMVLRIGYLDDTPEQEAVADALARWAAAHSRAGRDTPPGEPPVVVVRDNPERVRLGEYMVVVGAADGGGGDDSGGDQ